MLPIGNTYQNIPNVKKANGSNEEFNSGFLYSKMLHTVRSSTLKYVFEI